MQTIRVTIVKQPDFAKLQQVIGRPLVVFKDFREYRKRQFRVTVARGIDPYGVPYKPLSSAYAESKRRAVGERPILTRTGAMIRSYWSTVGGNYIRERVDAPAIYHQSSNSHKRLVFPEDYLPQQDEEYLLRLAEEHILKNW